MKGDLVKVLLIAAILLVVYYLLTSTSVIANTGEVELPGTEGYQQPPIQSPPAQGTNMLQYHPSSGPQCQPQVDNSLNAMSNLPQFAQSPEGYSYDFQPGKEPPRAGQ